MTEQGLGAREVERRFWVRVISRACEEALHRRPLKRGRLLTGDAFAFVQSFFVAAARQVDGAYGVVIRVSNRAVQQLAAGAKIKRASVNPMITLWNDCFAGTLDGIASSPIKTERGPLTVRFHMLAGDRARHLFWFEVFDQAGVPIIETIPGDATELRLNEVLDELLFAQVLRSNTTQERLRRYFAEHRSISVLILTALTVMGFYIVSPPESKAAFWDSALRGAERIWRVFTRSTPAGATLDVVAPIDYRARLIELQRVHVTAAMYMSGPSLMAGEGCDENGRPFVHLGWHASTTLEPPYVLVRNNRVYREPIMDREQHYQRDYGVLPGRSYTYALGKRDPSSGDIDVGFIGVARPTPCRAGNQPPIISIFPDPPSGRAPLRVGFSAYYADDDGKPPTTFIWNFGDEKVESSKLPYIEHEYLYGGDYSVTVSAFDSNGRGDFASIPIVVVGPPRPDRQHPPNPLTYWLNQPAVTATPIVGEMDKPFVLHVKPELLPPHRFPPAVYRWIWGDCLEAFFGRSEPSPPEARRDCSTVASPATEARRTFDRPGQFNITLEITFGNGDVTLLQLGKITVLPDEAYIREHPLQTPTWQAVKDALNKPVE